MKVQVVLSNGSLDHVFETQLSESMSFRDVVEYVYEDSTFDFYLMNGYFVKSIVIP